MAADSESQHGCRLWAISDLHVEHKDNLRMVEGWSRTRYQKDILLLAGDVTDDMKLLARVLKALKSKFREVFFVPGNHELWVRPQDDSTDSVAKFYNILILCDQLGVHYMPKKVKVTTGSGNGQMEHVWIVPLFSWYATPEDDPKDTLYVKPQAAENVELMHNMWMDNKMCIWPPMPDTSKSRYFADLNEPSLQATYDAPVVSFSHVLPRRELIRPSEEDIAQVSRERKKNGCAPLKQPQNNFQGGAKNFNFARVAGCHSLEKQIRKIGSMVHVYGHQHRNRDRVLEGVRYVSHCLGKPAEQKEGWTYQYKSGPKLIWPQTLQQQHTQ